MYSNAKLALVVTTAALLALPATGAGPKPKYEACSISGDVESFGEVVIGANVPAYESVYLRLASNLLAVDGNLIASYGEGDDPIWKGDFDPSPSLLPGATDGYYYGNIRLLKNQGRLDFFFSPVHPCTNPPTDEGPGRSYDSETCPFALVILDGITDTDSVTFDSSARVLLMDYTLGPVCPKEEDEKPGKGNGKGKKTETDEEPPPPCVETGGFQVGSGPVSGTPPDPGIIFQF
jgi:hypothetical protein